jgi:hypothetical protein
MPQNEQLLAASRTLITYKTFRKIVSFVTAEKVAIIIRKKETNNRWAVVA